MEEFFLRLSGGVPGERDYGSAGYSVILIVLLISDFSRKYV
jgi:hypothetical protein